VTRTDWLVVAAAVVVCAVVGAATAIYLERVLR
jgi:hypothetical protein